MRRISIFCIRMYRRFASQLFPPRCRFYPSCSDYAIEAITKKGIIIGAIMSIRRIVRCNPFCDGGYDPVR